MLSGFLGSLLRHFSERIGLWRLRENRPRQIDKERDPKEEMRFFFSFSSSSSSDSLSAEKRKSRDFSERE